MKNTTFMRFPGFRRKAVTLSYDDGVEYDLKLIDIMIKYGLRGTFNISAGLLSPDGDKPITLAKLKEIYLDRGQEVAAHGYHHYPLATIPEATGIKEIIDDRTALEQYTDTIVFGMAYAYGNYDDTVLSYLGKCGIRYARTVNQTLGFAMPENFLTWHPTCHHSHGDLMAMAKKFVEHGEEKSMKKNTPEVFFLWGHSYEYANYDTWHIIEEFGEYIGGREDIWYATNGEIYAYTEAYSHLVFSVDASQVYNPTATDLYLCYLGKNVLVPAGQTVKMPK